MGRHDPDNRPNSQSLPEPLAKAHAEAPIQATEAGNPRAAGSGGARTPSAAGSLMSVQIRRTRPQRKRAPCGPAATPEAKLPAPAKKIMDPATLKTAARKVPPTAGKDPARRGGEIIAYWKRLRGSRLYPAVSDLDPDLIAADWPNSILFRCRAGSGALMPDMSFLPQQTSGGSLGGSANDGKILLSPMMLQWLVSLAEDALRNQRPIEDTEAFPAAQRAIGYRAVALPLGDSRSEIDHVLCHVKCA